MTYLLDANVFITAKNAHYGMDFAPVFWQWVKDAHVAGLVYSIEAVKEELKDGGDELAEWIQDQPASFYKAVDGPALLELGKLTRWVNEHETYTQAAKATFLDSADYYLVGQGKALGFTVVTHEVSAPEGKARVKIPDACAAIAGQACLPWKMLRDSGARFTA